MVDWNEQIKAHLVWMWGEEEGFLKRGKEGMLVITDRRIAFISKTNRLYPILILSSVLFLWETRSFLISKILCEAYW